MTRRWLLIPALALAACGARPDVPAAPTPSCALVPLAPGAPEGAVAFGHADAPGAVWRDDAGTVHVSTADGSHVAPLPVPGAASLTAAATHGGVLTVAAQPSIRHRATLWDVAAGSADERPALVLDDRMGRSVVVTAADGGDSAVFVAHVGDDPHLLMFRDGDTAWRGVDAPGAVTRPAAAVDDAGTAAVSWVGVDDRIGTLWLVTWHDGEMEAEPERIALFEAGTWFGDPSVVFVDGAPVVALVVQHAGGSRLHVWRDGAVQTRDLPAWMSPTAPHLLEVGGAAYVADIADNELVVARLDDLHIVARGPVPADASIRGAGARLAIDADGAAHRAVCPLTPVPPSR